MFARQSGRVSICLRCQARALLQAGQPLHPRADVHRSLFHASNPVLEQDQILPRLGRSSSPELERRRHGFRSVYIRGKLRGKRGREVRDDAATLPVNTLGQPAEVIILRDAPSEREHDAVTTPPSEPSKRSSPQLSEQEIIASLAQEKEDSWREKVDQRIQSLRPKNAGDDKSTPTISRREYKTLERALIDGFTSRQLKDFLKRNQPDAQSSAEGQQVPSFAPWRPGTTPIGVKLSHGPIQVEGLAHGPKQRTVARIARELWRIDIAEEVSCIGELEFAVPKTHLSLFMANGSSILHDIGSRNNVRLEARASDRSIRITAAKEPAFKAFREIESISKSVIVDKKIYTGIWSHLRLQQHQGFSAKETPIKEEHLALISSLSNTALSLITKKKGTRQVQIIAANKADHEEAYRLLRAICNVLTESWMKAIPAIRNDVDLFQQQSLASEFLPQPLQKYNYIRYQTAQIRSDEQKDKTASKESDKKLANNIDQSSATQNFHLDNAKAQEIVTQQQMSQEPNVSLRRTFMSELENKLAFPTARFQHQDSIKVPLDSKSSLWQQAYLDETSASIGHVLFVAQKDRMLKKIPGSEGFRLSQGTTFVDVIPGLRYLIPYLQGAQKELHECYSSLVFRLIPFPRQENKMPKLLTKLGQYVPDIYVEFPIHHLQDSNGDNTIPRVTAALKQIAKPVALPHLACDLKFCRSITQTHNAGEEAILGATMQEWIKKTQEAINKGGRIRAHSSMVQVAITPPVLSALGLDLSETRAKQLSIVPNANARYPNIGATYLFTTVEHRQCIPMTFEGYPLLLTSREGGKLGGRGYELKLSMPPSLAHDGEARRADREAFYQSAYRFAKLVDDAVHVRLSKRRKTESIRAESEELGGAVDQDQVQEFAEYQQGGDSSNSGDVLEDPERGRILLRGAAAA